MGIRIFQHKGKNYGVYESDCGFLVRLQAQLSLEYEKNAVNTADSNKTLGNTKNLPRAETSPGGII